MSDAALRPGISLEHLKNQRDYIAHGRPDDDPTVAAMIWACARIEQLEVAATRFLKLVLEEDWFLAQHGIIGQDRKCPTCDAAVKLRAALTRKDGT